MGRDQFRWQVADPLGEGDVFVVVGLKISRNSRLPQAGSDTGPLRQRVVHCARTTWQRNQPTAEPLRVERKIGAPEVGDAVADNPHLLPMLLTFQPRGERLDNPGLLRGGDLLLAWSALNPTPLPARLVATAALTDVILAESHRSLKAAALRNPRVAKSMASSLKMFDMLIAKLQRALASAWTRYRRYTPRVVAVRQAHR